MSSSDISPGWTDPDDAPELTEAWFDRADRVEGGRVVKRGRPPGSAKQQISLRIDRDVIAWFRAGGEGWQTRINQALRSAIEKA